MFVLHSVRRALFFACIAAPLLTTVSFAQEPPPPPSTTETPSATDAAAPESGMVLDAAGNMVSAESLKTPPPPPCPKGKKCKPPKTKKVKAPKMTPVSISRGTLTIDGMIGKAALNYDIPDLKFIYIYAPGIGTAIVSNVKFPGAVEQPKAISLNTLTIKAGGHEMQLYSDRRLMAKLGSKPGPMFVAFDPNYMLPSRFPAVGYGNTPKSPYVWPGSKLNGAAPGISATPPIPQNLQPKLAAVPCPVIKPGTKPATAGTVPPGATTVAVATPAPAKPGAAVAPPCIPAKPKTTPLSLTAPAAQ